MLKKRKPLPDKDEGREQKTNDEVGTIYPATTATVNPSCSDCGYYRPAPTPRRKPFCSFTGTQQFPDGGCRFFIGGGVHADL